MAQPARASSEFINRFGKMLHENEKIDEFTYHAVISKFLHSSDPNDVSAVGFAYALNDEDDLARAHFIKNLDYGNFTVAQNFIAFIYRKFYFNELREYIFDFSDNFYVKDFSILAGTEAYRLGYIDLVEKHLSKHASMFSREDDIQASVSYRDELVSTLNNVYSSNVCSPEQLQNLGLVTHEILSEHKITPANVSIHADFGGDYLVQLPNIDPSEIVKLNIELAERVCAMEIMDSCEMIARYTSKRDGGKDSIYDYKK
ncbi:TPA: hypothetical protein ACKP7N_001405 [Serratia marcescens]